MKEGGESFLNEKYPDLQHSEEVESAVKRQEVRTGEKAKDKNEKVEAYLGRLEEIFDVKNPKKERRVGILKDKLHEQFIVKPKDIPEAYFKQKSLDAWVDYFGSDDATYPNWLKYFAFRGVTKLAEYDKEKKEFKKRSKGTTGLFPDINR
ncbi:MAG: hypothetical protein NTV36_02885 [Candidatus Staskawiczbacteria bacterium]|nr:hypothetical protein [Candidatus Staskawiczbacteria bacterium]